MQRVFTSKLEEHVTPLLPAVRISILFYESTDQVNRHSNNVFKLHVTTDEKEENRKNRFNCLKSILTLAFVLM